MIHLIKMGETICSGSLVVTNHLLRAPTGDDEWRAYHDIRRAVLFEDRGLFGVYDEKHPDEMKTNSHPLILIFDGVLIGVIRIDIALGVAWFRRVAVRKDLQRAGHGRILIRLAETFARAADLRRGAVKCGRGRHWLLRAVRLLA